MTTLLVVGGATPSSHALRFAAAERAGDRTLDVLVITPQAAAAFEGQGHAVARLGDWILKSGSPRLDDLQGTWDLCGLVDRELRLSGSWVVRGVDTWDASRIDFALYGASKWVRAINLSMAVLDGFRPERLAVEDCGTALNRALLAAASARGVPADALSSAAPPRGPGGLQGLRLMAAAARWAWPRGATRQGGAASRAIVLLNHARRNAEALQPVSERLQAGGRAVVHATVAPVAVSGVLPGAGVHRRLDRLPLGMHALSVALFAPRLASSVHARWRAARGRVIYRGVDVGVVASHELPGTLTAMLFGAALWAERAEVFLSAWRPALVVTTNERAVFGRAICRAAQARGLPVLLAQFGLVTAHPVIWSAPVAADAVAADGDESAEVLRSTGGCSNVVVTGQPAHDALLALGGATDVERARAEMGVPPGRRMVLYASHAFGEEAAGLASASEADRQALEHELRTVYAEVPRLPGLTLVVKPHPNESMEMHRGILNGFPGTSAVLLESTSSIRVPLVCCDVLITHHSTTGVDALVLGKPLMIVNFTGQPDAFPYVAEGVAAGAYRPEDVGPLVERLAGAGSPAVAEPIRQAFLRRHAAGGDGRAAERVVALAEKLLASSLR
ncbi:MAG: CDP-glycerol glycerophosphotransferase family protein [Gemmatimonadales bacterium]